LLVVEGFRPLDQHCLRVGANGILHFYIENCTYSRSTREWKDKKQARLEDSPTSIAHEFKALAREIKQQRRG
jgi:hypothetical protein